MNALALEAAIEQAGTAARTLSAIAMPEMCETYERQRALRHLADGRMVLLAGGTGNPFFTTDTTAVLRAAEIGADAVLKATNVDGVYSADPKKDAECQALRAPDPSGGDRARPQDHGCHRLRACPGKSYAYHRILDPRERGDRSRPARASPLDARWHMRPCARTTWCDTAKSWHDSRMIRPQGGSPWQAQHTTSMNSSGACRGPLLAQAGAGRTAHRPRVGEPAGAGAGRGLR